MLRVSRLSIQFNSVSEKKLYFGNRGELFPESILKFLFRSDTLELKPNLFRHLLRLSWKNKFSKEKSQGVEIVRNCNDNYRTEIIIK